MRFLSAATLSTLFFLGCGGGGETGTGGAGGTSTGTPEPDCKANADCSSTPETPYCDGAVGECTAPPAGGPLGWGDGSPSSVMLTLILEEDKLRNAVDLEFNPSNPAELWVVNQKDDSVIIVQNPGTPDIKWNRKHDPDAMHFMHRPPAIAFGAMVPTWNQTFGTCGDGDNGGNDFMGPALFSADPAVFAKSTPGGLGSHLDMLHSTTFCRGIAHQEANVYWVFNSTKRSLDKYDFGDDHGPGNEDHSDGKIYRYVPGQISGVDGIPSHLFYRVEDAQLYVADTGNKRIAKLDTTTGTPGSKFSGQESIALRETMKDATFVDFVPPGTLEAPSGIEAHGELVYATDNAQSRLYAFDMSGQVVRTLDTGLAPGSLAGLTFGPDGKVYFVDVLTSRVYRIDPM